MKTIFLLTVFILFNLYAEQNSSTAFGSKKVLQEDYKTFKQIDGSTFKGIMRGVSYFSYIELNNGYVGVYNKETKTYEFAIIKDGKLIPSGISVTVKDIPDTIKKIIKPTLDNLEKEAFKQHL